MRTSSNDSVLNLLSFYSSVQEVCKLDSLMMFVSLFNELSDLFSGCATEGEDVVNESFPDERSVKPL